MRHPNSWCRGSLGRSGSDVRVCHSGVVGTRVKANSVFLACRAVLKDFLGHPACTFSFIALSDTNKTPPRQSLSAL